VGLNPTVLARKRRGSEVDLHNLLLSNLRLLISFLNALIEALVNKNPAISGGLENCCCQIARLASAGFPGFKSSDDLLIDGYCLVPLSTCLAIFSKTALVVVCKLNDL
jgi:hypothetical protein